MISMQRTQSGVRNVVRMVQVCIWGGIWGCDTIDLHGDGVRVSIFYDGLCWPSVTRLMRVEA